MTNAQVIFNAMLKMAPDNIDYNWSFYCGADVPYKKETYLGFKVLKFKTALLILLTLTEIRCCTSIFI